MDLQEWEHIPSSGFLEINDDGDGNEIFSRKHGRVDPNRIYINMNYFICPSPTKPISQSPQFVDSTTEESKFPNQIIPAQIPIQFHPPNQEQVKQSTPQIPTQISIEPTKIGSIETKIGCIEVDREVGSQVFFKKVKEINEFVDMKMDSPKSGNRGIMGESKEMKKSLDSDLKGEQEVVIWREGSSNGGGLNIWKWGLNGIGAICSFGVAAATICIVILGSGNKQNHHQIRFQLYEDDNKVWYTNFQVFLFLKNIQVLVWINCLLLWDLIH